MNQEIKKLLDELRYRSEYCLDHGSETQIAVSRAASILQAVFDPENQPSQYGTTLISSSTDS